MSDVVLRFKGLLFDLDGVMVDSTESVERTWREFAKSHGIDEKELLTKIHGMPHAATIERELKDRPAEIPAAIKRHEEMELERAPDEAPMPGALELVASLPDQGWAIVTSCWIGLAEARAAGAGIALPSVLVTADQLEHGKPAPDGYLKGAELLGLDPADCVVFEDAPAGIEAGKAAGATVVALRTTTPESKLGQADHIVDDLSKVKITTTDQGFEIRLSV